MRNRVILGAGLFAVAFAAALTAQGSGMAGMNMDPTNKINGSGKLPAGWMNRFDEANHQMTEVDVQQKGKALHFRSGPAAIYYNPTHTGKGEYTASAVFSQTKTSTHEAYGLFIGGANLQDSTQNYLYFLVRPSDGAILISHRASNAKPNAIVSMTPDAAVNKDTPGTGAATNALAIRVARDSVHFYANGKEVRTIAKSALDGALTDGIAGIRVNHNLDITVENFGIKK